MKNASRIITGITMAMMLVATASWWDKLWSITWPGVSIFG